MKILVTALYVNGLVSEGGSSLFMKSLIDNLRMLGHDVVASDRPETIDDNDFDLIISSHNYILNKIKHRVHRSPIFHIGQGIIADELFVSGATRYYSISEEVANVNYIKRNIASNILPQPIELQQIKPINNTLQNILIVRRYEMENDPFNQLHNYFNVKISDQTTDIIPQMEWADLCITLGRGALQAMSLGRTVLVGDNRRYMGPIGDGYVSPANVLEIARCNFSGRRYKMHITTDWLLRELSKYSPSHSQHMHKYIELCHDAKKVAQKLLLEYHQHITNR